MKRISACSGPSDLSLQGHGFSTITGNGFDRLGIHSEGTVQLLGNFGNSVVGDVSASLGVVAGPSLECSDGSSVCIQGNNFLVPDAPQVGHLSAQVLLQGEHGALVSGNAEERLAGATGSRARQARNGRQ